MSSSLLLVLMGLLLATACLCDQAPIKRLERSSLAPNHHRSSSIGHLRAGAVGASRWGEDPRASRAWAAQQVGGTAWGARDAHPRGGPEACLYCVSPDCRRACRIAPPNASGCVAAASHALCPHFVHHSCCRRLLGESGDYSSNYGDYAGDYTEGNGGFTGDYTEGNVNGGSTGDYSNDYGRGDYTSDTSSGAQVDYTGDYSGSGGDSADNAETSGDEDDRTKCH